MTVLSDFNDLRAPMAQQRSISGLAMSLAVHGLVLAVCALTFTTPEPIERLPITLDVTMSFEPPGPPPDAMAEALASLSRLAPPPVVTHSAATLPTIAPPPAAESAPTLPSAFSPPQLPIPPLPSAKLPPSPPPPTVATKPAVAPPRPTPVQPKQAPAQSAPAQTVATANANAAAETGVIAVMNPGVANPGAPSSAAPAAEASNEPMLVTHPDYRSPPSKPVYPRRAIDLGLEGEVLVRAQIDESGDPLEPAVWRSSGHPLLDRAAIDAVRRWRFKPALRNGRAVAAIVQVPISFRLQ